MSASSGWWFNAIVCGRIATEEHPEYIAAKAQIAAAVYRPSRLDDLRAQAELTWKMADEGLLRIHDRMDKLLTTCLAIFGLVVSAMQIGKVAPHLLTYLAVGCLVGASTLLLISRLPIQRFAPTDLHKIAHDSCLVPSENGDGWRFLLATNYYLARVECDISASVLSKRMAIVIVLLVLALLLLAAAVGFRPL